MPVIWVNPPYPWRTVWLNPGPDVVTRTGFSNHESGLVQFHSGRWLPQIFNPRFLAHWFQRTRLRMMVKALKKQGCEKVVLYVTRPVLMPSVPLEGIDRIVYHVFDDYSYSATAKAIDAREKSLLERCDLPLFSSEIMLKDKGSYNANAMHLPNGVDVALFAQSYPVPNDMKSIPGPIVGYSGVIKKQLDLELALRLATQRPNCSFVFVGPVLNVSGFEGTVSKLKALPNTYFLGKKQAHELPAYIKCFDVGLMFYVSNNYTKYITPLKLNEYLASGIHVVGTRIAPLEPYGDYMALAETDAQWLNAIDSALAQGEKSVQQQSKTAQLVNNVDWEKLTQRMRDAILNVLD